MSAEESPARAAGLRPALFLDRDGTICALVPYLSRPRDVALLPGAAAALSRAQAGGWRLVVVTNQSGIARGLMTRADVDAVHAQLDRLLRAAGVAIDGYYVCPHHPDYTGLCACRKPAPGLLLEAARDLGIDLGRSALAGDTVEDVTAGAAAGCRPFLVMTGYGAEQVRTRAGQLPPGTQVVTDLPAAVQVLLPD